ncbi:beta-N-acetylhexosaminidase, partial [Alteromonas sp. 14N.309.X.WAT.G.H12]|uniref:beta-N-acetylhexosaminidase n=1 Tax=Alteromonas sp. 14N.309.X.WAT.G.H12 TaxID=3120824 RepID=UPI002FD578D2
QNIIPKPLQCVSYAGEFVLGSCVDVYASKDFVNEVARWQDWFKSQLFVTFVLHTIATPSVSEQQGVRDANGEATITVSQNAALNREGYCLTVKEKGIHISARSSAGVFYAFQTLCQLIPNEAFSGSKGNQQSCSIPLVDIKDSPRFSYRGMHLDVARRFMPVSFIKHFIDLLALHKINRFHWHLTDDQGWRIEIRSFPKLTESAAWRNQTVVGHTLDGPFEGDGVPHGGYYSQDEVREIVAYAETKHVMVVPEIDLPGHATAFLHAYPQFGCAGNQPPVEESFGIFQHVLCPTSDTFDALRTLFTDIADLFPGDYIHLGGDEVVKTQWQHSDFVRTLMQTHGWESYDSVHHYFIKNVSDIIISLGKKPIGWNEVIEGGDIPGTTIMCWQNAEVGFEAAKSGYEVIMSPASHTYFDFYQSKSVDEHMAIHGLTSTSKVYHFEPIPEPMRDTPAAANIIGIQGQLWSEYVVSAERVEYMVLPRMTALAEVAWSQQPEKNWADFSRRLQYLLQRFALMGLNVSEAIYAPQIQSQLHGVGLGACHKISFHREIEDDIAWLYTVDGTEPKHGQPYKGPFVVSGNTTVRVQGQCKVTGRYFPTSLFQSVENKLIGARVNLAHCKVNREWNPQPEKTLVCGISQGQNVFHADQWVEFPTGEATIEIELAHQETFSQITLGYTPGLHRHFLPPRNVQLWRSDDGHQWKMLITATDDDFSYEKGSVTVHFAECESKFLKLLINTDEKIFDRQTLLYRTAPLMLDQIVAL